MSSAAPALMATPREARDDTLELLRSVGEVVYRWSIPDDRLVWDGDTETVLGIPPHRLATGRALAAFQDTASQASRRDAVLTGGASDRGAGVPFHVEYGLRPAGPDGPLVWVEDFGRWYGDGGGPQRAVGVVRVISDRHDREQRLAYRSTHDELTGTFNRVHLLERLGEVLAEARRMRSSAAFLVISVDNFRVFNDTYGFDIADQVLAETAQRIGSELRRGDALGRLGGNKIGAILNDCDEEALATAAERFLTVVRDRVVPVDGGAIAATASIGGIVLPRHAGTVAEACARVEEALHTARAHGYGRFVAYVHSHGRDEQRRSNAAAAAGLIRALEERRLRLAFQPIVDIVTRRPVLHEALLRLEQPDGETISAGSFMPMSGRLGLSRLLDQRALELAIEALKASPASCLSVNVTPDTAADPAWLALLSAELGGRGDLASRLTVEITETTAIRDHDEAAHFVAAVKTLGCRVALDDFGAGYTSFRTLRQLDIDMIKIDGSYLENLRSSPDDQLFVRTLADLARRFELTTVAEWVGDEESVAMLASWGVDYIQGELTGGPVAELPREEPGSGAA